MDRISVAQRSELMSRIGQKDTGPEVAMRSILRKLGLQHESQPGLPGKPDFLVEVSGRRVALFVHGCFWHRCPEHFRLPKTRSEHWARHVGRNVARHRRNFRLLRGLGYRVAVVWEHELPRKKKGPRLADG